MDQPQRKPLILFILLGLILLLSAYMNAGNGLFRGMEMNFELPEAWLSGVQDQIGFLIALIIIGLDKDYQEDGHYSLHWAITLFFGALILLPIVSALIDVSIGFLLTSTLIGLAQGLVFATVILAAIKTGKRTLLRDAAIVTGAVVLWEAGGMLRLWSLMQVNQFGYWLYEIGHYLWLGLFPLIFFAKRLIGRNPVIVPGRGDSFASYFKRIFTVRTFWWFIWVFLIVLGLFLIEYPIGQFLVWIPFLAIAGQFFFLMTRTGAGLSKEGAIVIWSLWILGGQIAAGLLYQLIGNEVSVEVLGFDWLAFIRILILIGIWALIRSRVISGLPIYGAAITASVLLLVMLSGSVLLPWWPIGTVILFGEIFTILLLFMFIYIFQGKAGEGYPILPIAWIMMLRIGVSEAWVGIIDAFDIDVKSIPIVMISIGLVMLGLALALYSFRNKHKMMREHS